LSPASFTTSIGADSVSIQTNSIAGEWVQAPSGSFSFASPAATSDVSFLAEASGNPLAIKIFRNQTLPEVMNGGSIITFGNVDLITTQPISFSNVPNGFSWPPSILSFL